jgi:hypothetical protein
MTQILQCHFLHKYYIAGDHGMMMIMALSLQKLNPLKSNPNQVADQVEHIMIKCK